MNQSDPKIWIFQQYYTPSCLYRRAEITSSIYKNYCLSLQLKWVKFVLLVERGSDNPFLLPPVGRISFIPNTKRISYSDWINLSIANCLDGDISILINADCYLEVTSVDRIRAYYLQKAHWGSFMCVTRHQYYTGELYPHANISQDMWAFRMTSRQRLLNLSSSAKFSIGLPGCDNKIAYVAETNGLVAVNLCHYIRVMHIHLNDHREYTQSDRLPGPYYFVAPPNRV